MMSYNKYNLYEHDGGSSSEYAEDAFVWNQVAKVFPRLPLPLVSPVPPSQSLESRYHVFDCLAAQPLLTPHMRDTVLKWICAVNRYDVFKFASQRYAGFESLDNRITSRGNLHRQFRYHLETLCLTVALLDRFLFTQPIEPAVLQLAAATAFFVAAKVSRWSVALPDC